MTQVSAIQVRKMMMAIPAWARSLPNIADSTPFPDCGLDSLALLELVSEIQRIYCVEIPDDDIERISSIIDTARYLSERVP